VFSVAVLRGSIRFELGLGQRISPLSKPSRNTVFAPMAWGFGKVRATALAVDHKVLRGTVALAGHFGLAIGQQLDIAVEHNRYRLVTG
jgi:hypothetical protein